MQGVADSSNEHSQRYRPDVIICDQISACIPFLKHRSLTSWLFQYTPKVSINRIFQYKGKKIVKNKDILTNIKSFIYDFRK